MATNIVLALFILGLLWLAWQFVEGALHEGMMPFSCPRCAHGGEDGGLFAQQPVPWYAVLSADSVACRHCGARFREHPNGSLVRDRS